MDAQRLIELLNLAAHPAEGGFFRETYRSSATFEPGGRFLGARSCGTAIYYLLTRDTFSAMHRLAGDEVFHFYVGDPVEMLMLHPGGEGEIVVLGPDLERGMRLQHAVPGGTWQGSRLIAGGEWALLGTTLAPGFDYEDYVGGGADLIHAYPSHRAMIGELLGGG